MSIFRPGGLERDYELPKLVHHITTIEPYQFERIPINTILLITHTEKVVQKKRKGKNLDTITLAYPIVSHKKFGKISKILEKIQRGDPWEKKF